MRRKAGPSRAVRAVGLPRGFPLQSAMEYLMTYGWAILIIAVVLGSLYSLGVFNTANLQPKVPGGGCHVYRPNGPGTSWNINLVGSCQSALPQYVAQFNGQGSTITRSTMSLLANTLTFTVWFYYSSDTGTSEAMVYFNGKVTSYVATGSHAVNIDFNWINGVTYYSTGKSISPGVWHFLAVTYDGSNIRSWLDGSAGTVTPATNSLSTNPGTWAFGSSVSTLWWSGNLANVQVYNTSLTANQVQYLYNEGIGGMPIDLQHLVGWWPLNGDATDYSGNNNNGASTAISFNGSWASGYYS